MEAEINGIQPVTQRRAEIGFRFRPETFENAVIDGAGRQIAGHGNGPIDAFTRAIREAKNVAILVGEILAAESRRA